MGLPSGRRSPKGRSRWYLARAPEGRERTICDQLRRLLPGDLLEDCFVMHKERWFKKQGVWSVRPVPMYRGYLFAVSRDATGLARACARLTVPVELVGTSLRSWVPLSDEASGWYAAAMDRSHVIRSSTGVIDNGVLYVRSGPLKGQESRISKVDRHRRSCRVCVVDGESGFSEQMPINVPFKS